eukprot:2027549-Pyramimonas_sp.AAC.1
MSEVNQPPQLLTLRAAPTEMTRVAAAPLYFFLCGGGGPRPLRRLPEGGDAHEQLRVVRAECRAHANARVRHVRLTRVHAPVHEHGHAAGALPRGLRRGGGRPR